jgi:5-methylthioadenosine/S-adenosylhomocysteine deaminase
VTTECDLLISNGRVVDPSVPGGFGTHVAVRGNTVVEVGDASIAERCTARRVIDAAGGLVAPGFVDAHVHLSAFLGRAQPYQAATGPGLFAGAGATAQIIPMIVELCSMPLPAELTAAVLRPVMGAMLRAGITGVVDAGSSGLDGLVAAAVDTGIRAAIGPSLADTWHDRAGVIERRADTDAVLTQAHEWVERHDGAGDGRVRALVSAVEPIAASDELLSGMAHITGERHPVHVHSHISPRSLADHDDHWQRSQTDRLRDAGLLHTGCTLMHTAAATDADVDAFAEAGVTVNWNPLGNAMLGFGVSRLNGLARLRDAGVPIVMGSDYAPSMIASPFEMIRVALALQRELGADDTALTLEQVLPMSWNGAVSLGQPGRLGRVAAGQLADLVLIDTSGPHHLGDPDPAPAIALRARSSDVRTVIVDGRVVVDEGALVTIDEQQALANAGHALDTIRQHLR